jgi:signal transduction histidine kinase
MVVADDGMGVAPTSIRGPATSVCMRERAELAGGRLSIASSRESSESPLTTKMQPGGSK